MVSTYKKAPLAMVIFTLSTHSLIEPFIVKKKDEPKRRIELQGHRGSRGLSPENTWDSFITAIRNDMTAIELDLNITTDLRFIIHHDFVINAENCSTTDKRALPQKPIYQLSSHQLNNIICNKLNKKEFPQQKSGIFPEVLNLTEFFTRMKRFEEQHPELRKIEYNLELKLVLSRVEQVKPIAKKLITIIKTFALENRVMVQSFYHPVLPYIKSLDNRIKTVAIYRQEDQKNTSITSLVNSAKQLLVNSINIEKGMANLQLIQLCHENRISVILWTVNDNLEMRKYFNMGVDGMVSDYPDRLSFAYKIWSGVESIKGVLARTTMSLIRIPESLLIKNKISDVKSKKEFKNDLSKSMDVPLESIKIIKEK